MLDRWSFSGYTCGNKQTFWHDPEPMPYFLINDTTTEQTLSILIKTCKMLINTWLSVKKLWERALYTLEISLFVRSFVRLFVCVCLFVCMVVCMFGVFRPTREFLTHMETSSLPVKCCKFWPRHGTHSHWEVRCHTNCYTGHPFIMSRLGFDHPTFRRGERSNRLCPAAVTKKLFLFQCLYILMGRTHI